MICSCCQSGGRLEKNAHLMAWSIVIGVVNWWSGCKFLSHGCHGLSSPPFIVRSVYPSLSIHFPQPFAPPVLRLVSRSPPAVLICPFSYRSDKWDASLSWNIRSWSQSHFPSWDSSHKIIPSYVVRTVCVGCQPTPSSENARSGSWGGKRLGDAGVPPPPLLVQMCCLIADSTMRKLFFSTISNHLQ